MAAGKTLSVLESISLINCVILQSIIVEFLTGFTIRHEQINVVGINRALSRNALHQGKWISRCNMIYCHGI